MSSSTFLTHLRRTRRDRTEPLHVLVVHEGRLARRRAGRLLLRIKGRLGARLRLDCDFAQLKELDQRNARTNAPLVELVFLAVSCCATMPLENLAGIISLLPTLKANHGALVFLSGTSVPRRLDSMLIEQFLHTCAKRAGVAFFSGGLPGVGCPGCGTPQPDKPARSRTKRFCVLHVPRNAGASHRLKQSKTKQTT